MLAMHVSREYLLKSRRPTWENAEVIDNLFGPVPLEVKNENWIEVCEASYKDTSAEGCINDSFPVERVCQRAYEETNKKICVHLDHQNMISDRVSLAPVDLNVKTKQSSLSPSVPPTVASLSKPSQGDGEKVCTICHKRFTLKNELTRHFRTHTGDKRFSRPQCEKRFTQEPHLETHLLIHSGIKKFSCEICHRKFTYKSNLTVHRRTHTGDKPFKCTVCNAMFSTSSSLNVHMRTHTGETPYQCEICERKFAQLGYFKTHLLIHSGEKPFACTYANCDKTFREKGNLQTHVRVHTKDKPYSCLICHKTFSHSSNCRRHAKQCSVTKNGSSGDSLIET